MDLTTYTDGLVPVLEEFIKDHRPKLPGAAESPYLFITQYGRPYSVHSLAIEIREIVAVHTGRRIYPHLIRSIVATTLLKRGVSFKTVSVLLGDTLKVTMDAYDSTTKEEHFSDALDEMKKILPPR